MKNWICRSRGDRLRVVVLGYVVRGPLGGMAWHYLQYVLGLARLGHDVHFFEDSGDDPECCYNPATHRMGPDPAYGLRFADGLFARAGLGDRWAYYDAHPSRWRGPCEDRALDICATADLLLNVSGANPLRPWLLGVPARAFIDTDPAFTQVRNLTDPAWRQQTSQHTVFFTFGENIARGTADVPDDGFSWQPTRQPVVPEAWPVTAGPAHGKFTTVMQWDSYPSREYQGCRYGMKADSFVPYADLPAQAGRTFALALGSKSAPREWLREKGWEVLDPLRPTRDPWTYQRFLQESRAEFSVAKHGYVVSRSGWFSERSACYLASGRPVVVQDTGFTNWLGARAGVLPFRSPEEALAAVGEVSHRYLHHCRAAREVVEEYFDASKVLPRLIEGALAPALGRNRG